MQRTIAIIQTGHSIPTVRDNCGDFDSMFVKNMQINKNQYQTFNVAQLLKFPEINNLAGVIVTGSPAMVTEKHEWSEATIEWLKSLFDLNIPILGVCYGHQLLAKALGGIVDWNPNGRQIGRVNMQLCNNASIDPLLSSLIQPKQKNIDFFATHLQSVLKLPDHVTLLGSSKLDPNHCFRYKQHIWGTQFHPEFNADILQYYVKARSQDIINEGLNPDEIINDLQDNDNGIQLLNRFKEMCFKPVAIS